MAGERVREIAFFFFFFLIGLICEKSQKLRPRPRQRKGWKIWDLIEIRKKV
jgi:hypothetical protein